AEVVHRFNQPGALHLEHRLTNDALRDAHLPSQALLDDALAGPQLAGDDQPAKLLADALAETLKGLRLNRHDGERSSMPKEICLVSRNASSPSTPSSRPQPLCLNPPKGAMLVVGTPSLIPIEPASSASATRIARSILPV